MSAELAMDAVAQARQRAVGIRHPVAPAGVSVDLVQHSIPAFVRIADGTANSNSSLSPTGRGSSVCARRNEQITRTLCETSSPMAQIDRDTL